MPTTEIRKPQPITTVPKDIKIICELSNKKLFYCSRCKGIVKKDNIVVHSRSKYACLCYDCWDELVGHKKDY